MFALLSTVGSNIECDLPEQSYNKYFKIHKKYVSERSLQVQTFIFVMTLNTSLTLLSQLLRDFQPK